MKIAIFGKRRQTPGDIRHITALLDRLAALDIFVGIDRRFYEALVRQTGVPIILEDLIFTFLNVTV